MTRPAVSEDELMAITIIGYNWSHNGGNYVANYDGGDTSDACELQY